MAGVGRVGGRGGEKCEESFFVSYQPAGKLCTMTWNRKVTRGFLLHAPSSLHSLYRPPPHTYLTLLVSNRPYPTTLPFIFFSLTDSLPGHPPPLSPDPPLPVQSHLHQHTHSVRCCPYLLTSLFYLPPCRSLTWLDWYEVYCLLPTAALPFGWCPSRRPLAIFLVVCRGLRDVNVERASARDRPCVYMCVYGHKREKSRAASLRSYHRDRTTGREHACVWDYMCETLCVWRADPVFSFDTLLTTD